MLLKVYLALRLKSIFRQGISLGSLGLLLLLIVISQLYHYELYSNRTIIYWALGYLYLFIGIHNNRKDEAFIKMYFDKIYIIYIIEYFILSLPLVLPLLIYKAIWHFITLTLTILVVSISKFHFYKQKIIPAFFSSISLEWVNGFRRYYLIFIFLLITEGISAFYANLELTLVVIGFMIIFISEFVIQFEPEYYLLQHFGKPKHMIIRLMKTSLFNFTLMSSPYFIIFFMFFSGQLLILFQIISISALIYTVLVLFKYAVFNSINQLLYYIIQVVLLLFGFLCIALPDFSYGYLIIIPSLFLFATKKITQLVNDQN